MNEVQTSYNQYLREAIRGPKKRAVGVKREGPLLRMAPLHKQANKPARATEKKK